MAGCTKKSLLYQTEVWPKMARHGPKWPGVPKIPCCTILRCEWPDVLVPVNVGVMLLEDLLTRGARTDGVGASTGVGGNDKTPGDACSFAMLTCKDNTSRLVQVNSLTAGHDQNHVLICKQCCCSSVQ